MLIAIAIFVFPPLPPVQVPGLGLGPNRGVGLGVICVYRSTHITPSTLKIKIITHTRNIKIFCFLPF